MLNYVSKIWPKNDKFSETNGDECVIITSETKYFIYKYKDNYNIIPFFEPLNGIITINDDYSNDGIINTSNLDINNYEFNINYKFNDISSNYILNVIINSDLYYEFNEYEYDKQNIIYPINYRNIGEFKSDKILDLSSEHFPHKQPSSE